MARVLYGSIITDIKGSIGGLTFQKNGSGTIARLKPRKTKTNTQKQRDQQPRLKEVQRNWNELSLVNKILWNDFASVNNKIGLDGQEKVLTGYQWFLTINENLLLIEQNILSVPPVYEIVTPINSITLNYAATSLYLRGDVSINLSIHMPIVYCSFIINSASKFDFNKCRFMNVSDDNVRNYLINQTATTMDYWDSYYNSLFPPQLGNKSFYLVSYVRFISIASGISSLAYTNISRFVWSGSIYEIE